MIRGVRKISSSRLSSSVEFLLNSHPSSGILLNPGVRSFDDCSVLTKMPPMTVVSPSFTCTRVSARCVSIGGMPTSPISMTRFAESYS